VVTAVIHMQPAIAIVPCDIYLLSILHCYLLPTVLSHSANQQERLGGKFVSISMEVVVRAPEILQLAYDAIGKDSRVKMKF